MSSQGAEMEKPDVSHVTAVESNGTLKAIDTVHNDEALKVLAQEHGEDVWDAAEEKRLVRKLDRKLLPILCLAYVHCLWFKYNQPANIVPRYGLQYYDKAMLSQAVRTQYLTVIRPYLQVLPGYFRSPY